MFDKKRNRINMKNQRGYTDWWLWIPIALLAGAAKFLYETARGQKMTMLNLLLNLSCAALAGWIVGSLCDAFQLDQNIKNAFVGIAGWAGINILEVLEKQLSSFMPVFFERIKFAMSALMLGKIDQSQASENNDAQNEECTNKEENIQQEESK